MKRGGRFAARLGLDGNSLRRRTDRIAVWGKAGLLALLLVGTPVACVAVGHWAYRVTSAEQRAQQAWRQVPGVVTQSVSPQTSEYYTDGTWTWARWTTPTGRTVTGVVPVNGPARAGIRIPVWIDSSGQWSGPPMTRDAALFRVVLAIVGAPVGLATLLAGVGVSGQWLLNRRRLAGWEADWARTGPRWTKQFWAHGL